MNSIIMELCISIISMFLDIDIKNIKKGLDKKTNNKESLEITESIDTVSKKLEESKLIIENALLEMNNQKKLFEQMKKEAEKEAMEVNPFAALLGNMKFDNK